MLRTLRRGAAVVVLTISSAALAQAGSGKYVMGSGGRGGSGAGGDTSGGASGTGDVYGDLVQILRDDVTGQPILEKRSILAEQDARVTAYCPVPLTADGQEIPFLPDSCDPDPAYPTVAIDYFGRLDGARTVETNFRMHLDEVIKKINAATRVGRDLDGRLTLESCSTDAAGLVSCGWVAVDSSQENMALYQRIMKYGHLQTDPLEVDAKSGDPSLGVQYHPALKAEDYAKFTGAALALLPAGGATACFGNIAACVAPQPLGHDDFVMAAGALAGSADKTGVITVDLVQYFNRMVDIPVATETTAAPAVTLPALIRDGPGSTPYEASCATVACDLSGNLPAPANEKFVDYSSVDYHRDPLFKVSAAMIKPQAFMAGSPSTSWVLAPAVPILPWLNHRNPGLGDGSNVTGFVRLTSDSLRTIELVHNYKIPADLWDFVED